MKSKTQDTRQHILDIGYQLMAEKGFGNVGLSELLKAAEVPKGSFYHYFKSKEQFGVDLINDYFHSVRQVTDPIFTYSQHNGYQKLMNFWQFWLADDVMSDSKRSLMVKMAAEASDLSESMRIAIVKGSQETVASLVECIEQGIEDLSVKPQDSVTTANLLYALWLGASLTAKIRKDNHILQQTLEQTILVLQNPPSH